ncbi:DMT family transporter [Romboutsia sp. CE17]|nr:DMT family transporter [Romboutsia sp. CE17]
MKSGAILSIFLFVAFQFQTIGLVYTTPSKNTFITAANVVIVPFIGYIIYKRKIDKLGLISSLVAKKENPIVLTDVQFCVAFSLLFVIQFISKEMDMNVRSDTYIRVIYLCIFYTAVCFLIQTVCQKMVTETKAAIILSTESFFGTILSVIIFKELITLKLILGCLLIFLAIIVSETKLAFIKKKVEIVEE